MGKIEKKNLILLLVLVVPAVVFVVFILLSGKEEAAQNVEPEKKVVEEVPIPEAQTVETKGKVTEYLNEQNKMEEMEYKKSQTVDNDVFMDEATGEDVDSKSRSTGFVVNETQEFEKKNQDVDEPVRPKKKRNVAYTKKENTDVESNVSNSSEKKVGNVEVANEESENYLSSMGIVESGSEGKSTKRVATGGVASDASVQGSEMDDFVPVILEQDVKIKNGSMVVFILKRDIKVRGNLVKKNSYVYCKANMSYDRCYLDVSKIKNVDGKIYTPEKLTVFDEKYAKGLELEGTLDKATDEAKEEQVQGVSDGLTTGNLLLDNSVEMLSKVVKKSARSDKSIVLYEGYKVYIKKDE